MIDNHDFDMADAYEDRMARWANACIRREMFEAERAEMHEEAWALRHSTGPGLPAPDDGGF